MKHVRPLWRFLPESHLKEWLRLMIHNFQVGNSARFHLRGTEFITSIHGIKMVTLDHPYGLVRAQQEYQTQYKIKPGDVVIDAGAFNGHLSLYFASVLGAQGKVISVECDQQNLQLMKKNFDRNNEIRNICIEEKALWKSVTEVDFYEQGNVASSIVWMKGTKRRVLTTTIDQIVKNHHLSNVNFIKMDIEGAELQAIVGASATIKSFSPSFAVASYHTVDGKMTYPFVEDLLQSYGYTTNTIWFGRECITFGRVI